MKKIFSSIIILIPLLLILWALTGWYLGSQAEHAFRQALQENTRMRGEKLFRAELLDYNKTLMGAKATLRISSDMPYLSERFGDVNIKVRLLNGPLFITKTGVSVGSSRWFLRIDDLADEDRENLKAYFPEALPTAIVRLDFEQKAHYVLKASMTMMQALATGVFDLQTRDNRGAITLDNLQQENLPGSFLSKIRAEKVNISYQHQKEITAEYKPGTTSIKIPSLQLFFTGQADSVQMTLTAKSNISSNNNYLNGFIKIDLENISHKELSLERAKLSLLFKGISADGFIALSDARAEFDNLQQQADWILHENGEFPEGQDQIWELYDRIDEAAQQLPEILLKKVMDKDSLIQLSATTKAPKGASSLSASMKIAQDKMYKNRGGVSNNLLSLFQAEAKVKLGEDLYPLVSAYFPETKKQFNLTLKGNKLLMQLPN